MFYRDGRPIGRSSRRLAALNKETNMHQAVIPRTQKMDYHNQLSQKEYAAKLAPLLIEKLERVRKERETQELLKKKLTEVMRHLQSKAECILKIGFICRVFR